MCVSLKMFVWLLWKYLFFNLCPTENSLDISIALSLVPAHGKYFNLKNYSWWLMLFSPYCVVFMDTIFLWIYIFLCVFPDFLLEHQFPLSLSGSTKRGKFWALTPKLHTTVSVGTLRKNVNSPRTGKLFIDVTIKSLVIQRPNAVFGIFKIF